jgi:hypothetical protein
LRDRAAFVSLSQSKDMEACAEVGLHGMAGVDFFFDRACSSVG